jgi:hypothetical protein
MNANCSSPRSNFLPEEFLAIVSEKSNIKHEHISAKSNRLRLCLDK